MGKFSRDLDEALSKKVKNLASEIGLGNYVNIEPLLLKSKREIGCVMKANELTTLFTGDDSLIAVGINADAFDRVDEQVQEVWIRGLLAQVEYDFEKDKINIKKPELQIDLGVYHKFGDIAVKNAELAVLTLQQITDEEERLKAEKKKSKKK